MASVRPKGITISLSIILLLTTCQRGFGQAITGDILGTVQDSTGAVVPGAQITLIAVDTGIKWEATSDPSGNYLFAQLKPGRYSVEATKGGFQTVKVSNIDLLVGQRPRVDIVLRVGQVNQSVTVSAGAVQLLDTQTSSMGQVVQDTTIVSLPLVTRNFVQLMTLSAGVNPIGTGDSAAATWTGTAAGATTSSIGGMRESNESFLIDGIESRNARFGSASMRPTVDAIQEFKMQTSDFSAEFGRSSGVVNMTLKSGTNTLHGDVYEFIRNNDLDANNFFYNLSHTAIPQYRQNDFGGTLGGPLVLPHLYNGHDKTFWFASYEGFRYAQGISGTALVPSQAQLQGNLADDSAGTGIFPTSSSFCQTNATSPKCKNVINPATGVAFAGNVISTRDPVAQKWVQFIPSPNISIASGLTKNPAFNVVASPAQTNNTDQLHGRLDHALGSKDRFFGSYSFYNNPNTIPGVMPLSGSIYPARDQLVTFTFDHIFSPTIVNEARLGYNRSKLYKVSQGADGPNYAVSVFNLANTSTNPFDFGVPNAAISGFTTPGSPSQSIANLDQNFQLVDNLNISRGKHDLKIGFNDIKEYYFEISDLSGIPSFSFSGQYSKASLGDFLLGDPYAASAAVGSAQGHYRSNYVAGYFQDDWRALPSLSLNLGIRYEYQQPPWEYYKRTGCFDYATGQVLYALDGTARNGCVYPDTNNFAPRFGLAYSPKFLHNTVIRGAFGIFYATDCWNELNFLNHNARMFRVQSVNSNPVTPTISLENMFPAPGAAPGTTTVQNIEANNRTPYVEEWDFDIQHTFGSHWLVDLGYVGNIGQKLDQRRNGNAPTPDPTGTIPIAQREPYPTLSYDLTSYDGGWSTYSALTARVEKRFSGGLSFLGSYTWQHGLDLGVVDETSMASRSFKILDKGNSDYEMPQRFVLSYVYELPFGSNKRFISNASGPLRHVVGGWQVSGITTFQMGQFSTPTLGVDWMVAGSFSTSVPNKIGTATPSNRTYASWVTPAAYVFPGCPSYTSCAQGIHIEGNSGRNSVENPGMNNWDLAVIKKTRVTERLSAEFRAEFFNAWNHAQFGAPNLSLSSGQFGTISSLLIAPRELQFALKLTF